MDNCNISAVLNFDGQWGGELNANLDRYDRAFPGRFLTFCHVDWTMLLESDAEQKLVTSLEGSILAGDRGLKVWKDLGLHIRDAKGQLVLPDDQRFDSLWDKAGELGIPVAIHTADPVAFFDPVNPANERLEELLAHPTCSFADPKFPHFEQLINALETVVARHRRTTFIGLHAGCYAENLGWVSRMLDTYDNFYIDIAQRIAELGRQPRATRALILRHPTRVLFGTDQIPPQASTYHIYFRFLETADEHFAYSVQEPPPWGGGVSRGWTCLPASWPLFTRAIV
jgi:Amidohydrolase